MRMFLGGLLTALLSAFWFLTGALSGLVLGKTLFEGNRKAHEVRYNYKNDRRNHYEYYRK